MFFKYRFNLRMMLLFFVLVILGIAIFTVRAGSFSFNGGAITINDETTSGSPMPASPSPSTVAVSGVTGNVSQVTVTITGFTHAFADDVDAMLQGPGGQSVMLFSDAWITGPGTSGTVNLTFSDSAGASVPATGNYAIGTFKPSDYDTGQTVPSCQTDTLAPTGTTLAVFNGLNGTSVNGTWNLSFTDDCLGGTGSVSSWSITIVTVVPPTINSGAPGGGTVGTPYTHTYTATGDPTITYALTAGGLPTGLNVSAAGVISGTPTASGTFTGTVTATNGAGTNDQTFSITIAPAPVPPTINSGAPGGGTVGTPYTHTYTASGDPTITYTLTAGALPAGLNVSAAGVISGTPTASGTFTGTVTATNGAGTNDQTFSITIAPAPVPPTINSGAPGGGTVGTPYTHTYTASGDPTITYTLTGGGLPTGLNVSAAGVISGTPTASGTFAGTVTATNGAGTDAQNFNITIAPAPVPPTIISSAPGGGTVGTLYAHTYSATGDPTITYALTAGALPTGLNVSAAGVISGTPTASGTFTGTVTATNGAGTNAQNFSITIALAPVAPTINSGVPGGGTVGTPYTHIYTATGDPTITYTLTAGALPPSLSVSAAGVISGTPTASGTFTGAVTATNGVGTDTQNFSITISTAPAAPAITSVIPPNGSIGTPYTHTYTATGDPTITYTLTAGALPTGLNVSAAGVISGTPTASGTFAGTVTATNGVGTDTQNFSITITTVPVISTPVPVVSNLPEPPPAMACADANFDEEGMVRTHLTNDADRNVRCRVIASGGNYMTWLGGQITFPSMVGDNLILNLGVIGAVDVFSPSGVTGFVGDVDICLKGTGYMIYMNANSTPRVPQLWSSWTTDAFPGYTCTTLYAPGTVIMVKQKP